MLTPSALADALREAVLAAQNAQEVRAYHRKRTARSDTQRNEDLRLALARVKAAMKPLRSEIGRFPKYHPTPDNDERKLRIRTASLLLQKERRKLWKMILRTPPEEGLS